MSAVTMFRRLFDTRVRTTRHPKQVRRPRLAIQELELRSLMAANLTASLNVADGILRVEGTDAADQIHVRHSGGSVRIDGIQIGVIDGAVTTPTAAVARDQITTIEVVALDGNDLVRMHDTLIAGEAPIPMAIHGDSGKDTLIGGDGADTISGGSGVDSIQGGAGEDALYGNGAPAAPAVPPGSVSIYSGEGNANDSSGGNDGILNGDVGFAPGKVGQAFDLDGALDYVDLGSDPTLDIPGDMSVSLWVRLDTLDNEKYFLADFITGNTSQGSLGTTGAAIWFQSYTDGSVDEATGVTPMQINQWYHLSAVRDDVAKTVRLFVNGNEEANFSYAGKTVVSLQGSKILGGSTPNFPGDYVDGQLDEVGIYNRALSDAEVQSLYLAGNPGGPDDGAADTLKGEDGNDYLDGGAGDDYMLGGDGNDRVYGAAGDDAMNGEDGADTLVGGDGNDVLRGGIGNDILKGAQEFNAVEINGADDKLYGEAGSDQIWGGDGHDTLVGGDNSDALYGERGDDILKGAQEFNASEGPLGANPLTWPDDLIDGGPGADQIWGGDGQDFLIGGDGRDALYGERGDDTLRGAQGNSDFEGGITADPATWPDDLLDGGAGDDLVYGGDGSDRLFGGSGNGNDTLVGGNGNDIARGGAGNDVLKGGQESDAFEVGGADDKLYGEAGSDDIWGGDGADTLVGGNGHDRLFGEYGDDVMKGANEFNATETPGDNYDYMLGGHGSDQMFGGDGDDTLVGGDNHDRLFGERGNDTLKGADEFSAVETIGDNWDYLLGGPGHDAIWGGDGDDTLVGGDGHDTMFGEAGNDTMKGADEFSAAETSGNNYDYMHGGSGNDAMWGGNGNDTLVGGDGFDALYGEIGSDLLKGAQDFDAHEVGGDQDVLDGGQGPDTMFGGDGDDFLNGGSEKDVLSGEAGNDRLFGGANDGADTLYGGANADRFLLSATWTGDRNYNVEDVIADIADEDARPTFLNGYKVTVTFSPTETNTYTAKKWTDTDVLRADAALGLLHKEARGTRLLERSDGGDLVIVHHGTTFRGYNDGWIHMTDAGSQFGGTDNSLRGYLLHEIGHNWQGAAFGDDRWNQFVGVSGWTSTNPNNPAYTLSTNEGRLKPDGTPDLRWYLTTATFTGEYAKTNENEDFAESFCAYFTQQAGWTFYDANGAGAAGVPAKMAIFATWAAGL